MKLRVGYELRYAFPQPTPAILMLNIHFTRVSDLAAPDHIIISPSVPISGYRDGFGNWCNRIVGPAGRAHLDRCRRERCRTARSGRSGCKPGSSRGASRGDPRLPASEPFLRQRPAVGSGLEIVRPRNAGLGARAGYLRFRAWAHRVRLRACAGDEDGLGGLSGKARRLGGLIRRLVLQSSQQ